MALIVPNLDRLTKESPKMGEALKRIQTYVNLNTTVAPGNRLSPPPIIATRIPG